MNIDFVISVAFEDHDSIDAWISVLKKALEKCDMMLFIGVKKNGCLKTDIFTAYIGYFVIERHSLTSYNYLLWS